MQVLSHPGSAPLADATWQKLVLLTTELLYEKSALLSFFCLIIKITPAHCGRLGKCRRKEQCFNILPRGRSGSDGWGVFALTSEVVP